VALRVCLLLLLQQQQLTGASHHASLNLRHHRSVAETEYDNFNEADATGDDAAAADAQDMGDGAAQDDAAPDAAGDTYPIPNDADSSAPQGPDAPAQDSDVPDAPVDQQSLASPVDNTVAAVATDSDAKPVSAYTPETPGLNAQQQHLDSHLTRVHEKVANIVNGMDNGADLHNTIAKTKVRVQAEGEKVRQLRSKVKSIHEAHDAAAHKLTDIMAPRIAANEKKFAKKHKETEKEDADFAIWSHRRAESQETIAQLLKQREEVMKKVEAKTKLAKEAEKDLDVAGRQLRALDSKLGTQKMDAHTLEAKYLAAKSDVERAQKDEENMRTSVDKARETLKEEQEKFDKILKSQEKKLEVKINKAEQAKAKAEKNLFDTQQKFTNWQDEQKQKAHEVTKLKRQFEEAQRAYNQRKKDLQQEAVDAAIDNPGADGTEDWAWKK